MIAQVCSRLGLFSLAYLWKQPQAVLLQGMIDAGIDAAIVKVAALGLHPAKHLGKSLQQMQQTLHGLNRSGCMSNRSGGSELCKAQKRCGCKEPGLWLQ